MIGGNPYATYFEEIYKEFFPKAKPMRPHESAWERHQELVAAIRKIKRSAQDARARIEELEELGTLTVDAYNAMIEKGHENKLKHCIGTWRTWLKPIVPAAPGEPAAEGGEEGG